MVEMMNTLQWVLFKESREKSDKILTRFKFSETTHSKQSRSINYREKIVKQKKTLSFFPAIRMLLSCTNIESQT